ncbi:type II toxin-antitoxin system ParD family antitoxin [Methylobacterium terrae]|uniref:Type II toxin-antitoxin system ParD family antitoxin n=1 Tax=Methylobacterium terrae TaxID=2202827 RepID=A0A2U8WX61_9HYPH|nr:type II toxin-antitoxin system ParD family antitoxin [Methylobacterium terrae]AWN50088.1 type II toxin-antitoxin system ParD family antitoxin [Methylobacterium terrae]
MTMNISLPDPMKEWVEAQSRSGRSSNASDSVRDLIRRDQERADRLGELQALVDAGTPRGNSDRTPDDIRRLGRDKLVAATKTS